MKNIHRRLMIKWSAFLILAATNRWSFAKNISQDNTVKKLVKNGTIKIDAFEIPLSTYMSAEAKQALIDRIVLEQTAKLEPNIGKFREQYDHYLEPFLEKAKALYPVSVEVGNMGGVKVSILTPKLGISPSNKDRVLLNLHGGAFAFGAGTGGLLESVPICGLGKVKIISIDYRQGPEYKFPAASEDIAAVYKALLKSYKPKNIGIFGCSSGGQLTAMSVPWFLSKDLPLPGALGILCGSADASRGGDSRYFSAPLMAQVPPPSEPNPPALSIAYLSEADLKNPLVSPITSPDIMAKFPPTVLVTGTRAYDLSSAAYTHGQLIKRGRTAELHVWDGMWHGFFYDVGLPESEDALTVLWEFFNRNLDA